MILDVADFASKADRLAVQYDEALMAQRALRINPDTRGRQLQAAANEVSRLRCEYRAALDAYLAACGQAADLIRQPPGDDQPTLFGDDD